MAARRLLAVMLVFFAISTVLAVLAPPPTENAPEPATRETSTKATTAAPEPRGRMVNRRVELVETKAGLRGRPANLAAQAGDQLVVTVSTSRRAVTLESASLGLTETAAPDAPARLDLFLSGPGRHFIRDAATGRRLLRISIETEQGKTTKKEQ